MQTTHNIKNHDFDPYDRRRLLHALQRAPDVRTCRRLQAVLLVAQGWSVPEVARSTGTRPWAVYSWVRRYLRTHRPDALDDAVRSGRPQAALRITAACIARELRRDPLRLGYNTTGWTVALLARHLGRQYHCPISPRTLRRRMRQMGLRWKRPRYVYATKDPHRARKKGAIVRRLKQMPPHAVLLFEDETLLRWFPPLRHIWAFQGEQAVVPITGRNAKRVLFGAINPRTGHRLLLRRLRQRQEDFQAFLRHLRQHYPGRPVWLLLDKAPGHDANRSEALAARLDIELVWLPKQCSELNAMDHVWKELKGHLAANRQFPTIDDEAEHAEQWVLGLTPQQALRKAGILSANFWLKDFL